MNADLNSLLKATSRSFYLTLRILPAAVRPQIGLAYLLARIADTIADTEIIPHADRLEALKNLRERILGQRTTPLNFTTLSREQGVPAERHLLEKVEASIAVLQTLSPADLKLVRDVLLTITSGQELDLHRFEKASPDKIVALETPAELDDYTYRVAGCVGEFWTRICRAHLFPDARLDEKQLIADGIRFGKGLQLVNILRDLPSDLKHGRCYLPTQRLEQAKLFPEVLFSPTMEEKFLPLYHEYLDKAGSHLRAGWQYTNTLPFGQFRVRLACAWPILIGLRNLDLLRRADVSQIRARVKVPRGEVYGIMLRSILSSPFPFLWRKLYLSPAKAVASERDLA